MTNRLGVLFLLVGAAAASPAFAGDSATMKCNATNDRVWVYDSLTSFDVSAKLKCGETVEITGRVKGYVKIRAANGAQGYVPESTFPDLPPYVDPNDSQAGVSIAKRVAPRAAVTRGRFHALDGQQYLQLRRLRRLPLLRRQSPWLLALLLHRPLPYALSPKQHLHLLLLLLFLLLRPRLLQP